MTFSQVLSESAPFKHTLYTHMYKHACVTLPPKRLPTHLAWLRALAVHLLQSCQRKGCSSLRHLHNVLTHHNLLAWSRTSPS